MSRTSHGGAAGKGRVALEMLPQTFAALRASAQRRESEAADDAGEPGFDLDPDGEENDRPGGNDRSESATAIVVRATFEASVTKDVRRRLRQGQALAVTILVPTTSWVAAVAAHARSEFGPRWCVHARDGSDRRANALMGSNEVARDLSRGLSVMGVSADAALLPDALTAAADIAVRIAPPDGAVLRKAIARFTRRPCAELVGGVAAGIDLHAIVAAFRPGTGPKRIAERLDAMRRSQHVVSTERVPDLRTAIEYGPARTWALNLVRDVAALKDSSLEFRHLDRGIILHSRIPGLGKSTFCRSVAMACFDAPLVSTSAGEWFSQGQGYLHTVVQHFRSAVSKARALAATAPVAFLAIEEVDAAVPDRATLSNHAREWHNIVISDILTVLDSTLASNDRVIVLASTNMIERVDPALLRPGRLEKVVEIKLPDGAGALNILRFHLDGELPEDLSRLGPLLAGSTGAEIMYAVRTARRVARHAGRELRIEDIERAVLPIEEVPPKRLFRMAVHEGAHAVAALALGIGTVEHVVLRERGASGGRTVVKYADADLPARAELEDRVVATLAARAAERMFTGSVSIGSGGAAESDIGVSTRDVASLYSSFGMMGDPTYLGAGPSLIGAVAADPELRGRVGRHMRALERRAVRLVEANREAVLAVAARLAEKRHLAGCEVEGIVSGMIRPRRRRGPAGAVEALR